MNIIKKNNHNARFRFSLLITLVTMLVCFAGTVACEPWIDFQVENQTNDELTVYEVKIESEKISLGVVSPGEIADMRVPGAGPPYPIKITNKQGEVIYYRSFRHGSSLGLNKIAVTTHGTRIEKINK
jgi:hypothetical protein